MLIALLLGLFVVSIACGASFVSFVEEIEDSIR
jgi:hypothetical protein